MELFSDLKVIELASVLAGPSAGMFFAELGAEVVKIENKKTDGDVTRKWKHQSEASDNNISAYFSSINYNKSYIQLDITDDADYQILLEYISKADVLITNFKLGDDVKFNLTRDTLRKNNPSLIHCQLFGFKDNSRPAFDAVLQAETGVMYMNGSQDGPPTKMPLALIDVLAGHQMKEAILIGLLKRSKNNDGSYFELSLEEAAISSLINQATNYLMNDVIPERKGSLHPNIAPYGETIKCLDGKFIVLAIGSNKQFSQFCDLLQIGELINDPKFSSNPKRVIHRNELCKIIEARMTLKSSSYWMDKFIENNIPAGLVKNMKEVLSSTTAQEMFLTENIDGVNTKRVSTVAFRQIE